MILFQNQKYADRIYIVWSWGQREQFLELAHRRWVCPPQRLNTDSAQPFLALGEAVCEAGSKSCAELLIMQIWVSGHAAQSDNAGGS